MRILKRLSQIALALVIASAAVLSGLFGSQIQENAHLAFIRMKMNDVAKITNSRGAGGTGWFTTAKSGRKIIITNGHVCGLAENGMVYVQAKGNTYVLKLIEVSKKHDLCALEAPQGFGSGFRIASSVVEGESVYTIGHPYLEPNTVSKGEYSGDVITQILVGVNQTKEQCSGEGYQLLDMELINPLAAMFGIKNACIRSLNSKASTIIILPGNSGSPDVNIYGNVVGVAYAANEPGTRSYHVPLSYLREFLNTL